jgi:hypothetical protein
MVPPFNRWMTGTYEDICGLLCSDINIRLIIYKSHIRDQLAQQTHLFR